MSDRPHILVPGKVSERIVARLPERFEVISIGSADPSLLDDGVAARIRGIAAHGTVPSVLVDALPHLEIIGSFGVGYDGIDVTQAASRGIVVTNTPDVLNEEVADTTVALLLNTIRRFPAAEQWVRQGRWASEGAFPLTPLTLRGRTVGLYGFGRIGQAIARRLAAFDVSIAYHTRTKRDCVDHAYHPTLKALAEAVDTLVVIVPGTESTRRTINADILAALGPNGVLISVGRGSTVDEGALVDALQRGVIAAAGLDVFEDEPHVPEALLTLPNVSVLPHVGSASQATRDAMSDLVIDNLVAWFERGKALTPVPETPFTRR